MRFLSLLIFILLSISSSAFCQYNAGGTQFYIGPKTAVNITRYISGKNLQNVPATDMMKFGYSAGVLYKFKINDNLSLHGEFSYARRTRSVTDSIKDISFQNYHIDAPIVFELSFPAKNKLIGKFEYYFNFGPQISYWLNGKGKTSFHRNGQSSEIKYDINFQQAESSILSRREVNQLQYGFIIGSGLTLPSIGDNFYVLELRYFFCQTYLGGQYSAEVENMNFSDDLRGNYNVISLSFAYTFGLNFKPNSQKSGAKVKTVVK